jgi:hypothetical protein
MAVFGFCQISVRVEKRLSQSLPRKRLALAAGETIVAVRAIVEAIHHIKLHTIGPLRIRMPAIQAALSGFSDQPMRTGGAPAAGAR